MPSGSRDGKSAYWIKALIVNLERNRLGERKSGRSTGETQRNRYQNSPTSPARARRHQITSIETIPIACWQGPFGTAETSHAVNALESGKVLYFPNLAFAADEACRELISPCLADQKVKNISYDPRTRSVKGTQAAARERQQLSILLDAFAAATARLVGDLFPRYAGSLECARTSFRPVEIAGREYSRLKDDRLLHIDAFPSTPTRGRRILRLFANINPAGQPRLWHIGEPFQPLAERFLPSIGPPPAPIAHLPIAYLMSAVGATRGRRSAYDQLMLGLHNRAKRDNAFQSSAPFEEFAFSAGSSWICFTDQVVHAALAGQYALEQTFYLDVEAMADPESSPLRILERMTGRALC